MVIVIVSILGLLIGSFLNVCIYRIPRDMSVIYPTRSFCPHCNTQLSAWENIPVISWLFLKGKCKTCKKPISGRYPLVELLSTLAATASYIYFDLTLTALIIYALTATLIVITFIDIDFQIIPDVINIPGTIIGLTISVISQYYMPFSAPITTGIMDSLIGIAAGSGFFLLVFWVFYALTKKEGIGMGDVKLMAFVGALLGWQAIPATIFIGSFLGAVFGIAMMAFKKAGRGTEIPFGPWLALGTIIYIFGNVTLFDFNF